MPTFTIQVEDLVPDGPVVSIQLGLDSDLESEMNASGQSVPPLVNVDAIIDTGAECSLIQNGLAEQLGLNPVGYASIHTPISSGHECSFFEIQVHFPQGVSYDLKVLEAPLPWQRIQCLLGRDFLSHAVFTYSGKDNQFTVEL